MRHTDHVTPHAGGGPTSPANGQGLCERCNHTKQAPGWTSRAGPARLVTTTTPTGHTCTSVPPPVLPSALSPPSTLSPPDLAGDPRYEVAPPTGVVITVDFSPGTGWHRDTG